MSMAAEFLERVGSSVSDLAGALATLGNQVDLEGRTRWTFDDGSTIEIRRFPGATAGHADSDRTSLASSGLSYPAAQV